MENLVDFFKKYQKAISIGAAAAFAIGAFYLWSRKQTQAEVESDNYIQKAKQLAKKIEIKQAGDIKYGMDTIFQVMEQSAELATQEYIEMTLKNRLERRALLDKDLNEYSSFVINQNQDLEKVIKKSQETILQILNVPFKDFEASVITYMERGHFQQIYMFQASLQLKNKQKIESTKNLTLEELKDILNFQLETLNQQPEQLKQLLNILSSPKTADLMSSVFISFIFDIIYQKFKIEEEDIIKVQDQANGDPEIIILSEQVTQAQQNILTSYNPGMAWVYDVDDE